MARRQAMGWVHMVVTGAIFIGTGLIYLHGNDFGQNLSPMGRAWTGGVGVAAGVILVGLGVAVQQYKKRKLHG